MGGGGKKKKKDSADIKKKKGEIKDLNKNLDETSENIQDMASDLEDTLAEKAKWEEWGKRVDDAAEAKWSEWMGELPEAGSKEMTQKERDAMRNYLEKYSNKMYDYYGNRANNRGKLGQDIRQTMTDGQVLSRIKAAYGHSKEFGDEIKKIVQDSRRFLWDRKADYGHSQIDQNMDLVKAKYIAQYGAYSGVIGEYRKSMEDIAKKRLSLEGYYKTETYNQDFKKWARDSGWHMVNGSDAPGKMVWAMQNGYEKTPIKGPDGMTYFVPKGSKGMDGDDFIKWNEKRGEEAFHAKYSDTDFSAMTLDELEHISSGKWDSSPSMPGFWGEVQKATDMTKQQWKQDQDWDRDIEDLDSFKWE